MLKQVVPMVIANIACMSVRRFCLCFPSQCRGTASGVRVPGGGAPGGGPRAAVRHPECAAAAECGAGTSSHRRALTGEVACCCCCMISTRWRVKTVRMRAPCPGFKFENGYKQIRESTDMERVIELNLNAEHQ